MYHEVTNPKLQQLTSTVNIGTVASINGYPGPGENGDTRERTGEKEIHLKIANKQTNKLQKATAIIPLTCRGKICICSC